MNIICVRRTSAYLTFPFGPSTSVLRFLRDLNIICVRQISKCNQTDRFPFLLSLSEASRKATKRAEIANEARVVFKRGTPCWASRRALFDFSPAKIHCQNEPILAEKRTVLPSSLGKKAFSARFLGLQPAHYQPKAF